MQSTCFAARGDVRTNTIFPKQRQCQNTERRRIRDREPRPILSPKDWGVSDRIGGEIYGQFGVLPFHCS